MSGRLSLSDVLQVQEARIDRLSIMLEAALEALTERRASVEKVTLKRTGVGANPTAIEVETVTHDGETVEDAAERARVTYEPLCARFPLPSGAAHAAPLGDWPGAE